jgi:hypothetical protein
MLQAEGIQPGFHSLKLAGSLKKQIKISNADKVFNTFCSRAMMYFSIVSCACQES